MNAVKLLPTLSFFLAASALAGTMGEAPAPVWSPFLNASIGPAWYSSGKTQTFFLQADTENTYFARKKSRLLVAGEVFSGVQRILNPTFSGQFGVALAADSYAKLTGDIWQNANPVFNNFVYNYKVNHTHIALKGSVAANAWSIIQPYVSASLGVGFNQSSSFIARPKILTATPVPLFASYSTTTFTYTLGAGLQKTWATHWLTGIGYEFGDWGKSHLNRAPGQIQGSGLRLSHIYTNQLKFTVGYAV